MSIIFACGSCGKTFTVEDRLGGKKGRCKDCGQIMLIPSRRKQADSRSLKANSLQGRREDEPDPSVLADVYGFNEPRVPSGAEPVSFNEPETVKSPIPVVKKKKKKRKGFFSGLGDNVMSAGDSFSIASSRNLMGGIGLALMLVILPILRGSSNGFTPRSEIEAYYKQSIVMADQLVAMLRKVDDVESARQSSAAINAKIREITSYVRKNMDRKGSKKDIDELSILMLPAQRRVSDDVVREVTRLRQIGALEALDIEAALSEQAEVERQIQVKQSQNFQ